MSSVLMDFIDDGEECRIPLAVVRHLMEIADVI